MASKYYDAGVHGITTGAILWASDTIKIALVISTYTFNQADANMTTIAASEPAITGYTGGFAGAGRKTLASKTQTSDTTNHREVLDAADPSAWTALAAGATLGGAVVYKHLTSDAASTPIAFLDFTDTATNGSDFSVVFDALGIAYWQN